MDSKGIAKLLQGVVLSQNEPEEKQEKALGNNEASTATAILSASQIVTSIALHKEPFSPITTKATTDTVANVTNVGSTTTESDSANKSCLTATTTGLNVGQESTEKVPSEESGREIINPGAISTKTEPTTKSITTIVSDLNTTTSILTKDNSVKLIGDKTITVSTGVKTGESTNTIATTTTPITSGVITTVSSTIATTTISSTCTTAAVITNTPTITSVGISASATPTTGEQKQGALPTATPITPTAASSTPTTEQGPVPTIPKPTTSITSIVTTSVKTVNVEKKGEGAITTGRAMASNVMPNLNGFEDGNWYKVRNVGDNNVIELDETSGKFICMPASDARLDVQLFRAIEQSNGTYRIRARKQKSSDESAVLFVWDYLPHRELLMQKKQASNDKFTQNWTSDPVPGYNSMYLVQSGPSHDKQKCLKNMGSGEQVRLIDKDGASLGDHFAHWYLELQDLAT